MLNYKNYLMILVIFFTPYFSVFAGEVFKARGRQAIVELKGIKVQPGDTLVAGSRNNIKANMRVKKINDTSSFALVDIIKGQVRKGDQVSKTNNNRSIASDDELYNEDDNGNDEENYDEYTEEADFVDNDNDNDTNETDFTNNNRTRNQREDTVDNTAYAYSTHSQRKRFAAGLFAGIDFNILKLKLPNNSELSSMLPRKNVTATGLSFNINAALDYDFMDMLGLRVFTGWKRFFAKSKDSSRLYDNVKECYDDKDIGTEDERDCELKIDLYGLNVQLQYYIPGGTELIQPLIGIGAGVYFLMNTSKNYAIKKVNAMGSLTGVLGVNVIISPNMYLAAQADYHYSLASSSTVLVHFLGAKVGLMYGF